MVVCPSCRSENMNGTLFCGECGADLQTPAAITLGLDEDDAFPPPPAPARSVTQQRQPQIDYVPESAAAPFSARASSPSRPSLPVRDDLQLIVLNSGRRIQCPDRDNVVLGRSDEVTGEMPDIDLAPDDALELGVSRRHACITFRNEAPFITDLGSTNRTFINRQLIMRGQPYPIKDGDEVRLGNAILKIIYQPYY